MSDQTSSRSATVSVPYVPDHTDLERHRDYLVARARAQPGLPVCADELAWVRSLGRRMAVEALPLPNAATRLALVAVVELFRHGMTSSHEVAVVHAGIVWLGQYRVAFEGDDVWDEERAELLQILERMAYDAAAGRGYMAQSDDQPVTFGGRLMRFRKQAGLTQDELADALGTSASVVRNWESNRHFPRFAHVMDLCRVLRCSPAQLFNV